MSKGIISIISVLIIFYSCTNEKKEKAIEVDSLRIIDTTKIVLDTIPSPPPIKYLMIKSKIGIL